MQNQEGHSINRPPFFDGTNYLYWKARMKIFIESQDVQIWWIIQHGPVKITVTENGVEVPKPIANWTEEERKRYELNSKAINFIFCAVNADEFKKLSRCDNAKEMWDKLQMTYEGTSDMKLSRIDMLMNEYETEKIDEMFERLGKILNDLDSLGERLSDSRVNRKVLRSLTPIWKAKVTAIQESGKADRMTFDELRGNLLNYEATYLNEEVENLKKGKGIALKATDDDEEDDSEDDQEDDVAMLARRLNRFYKRRPTRRYNNPDRKLNLDKKKESNYKKDEVTCYKCKRPGHIKPDCPLLKKTFYKGKKKAMLADSTWDDDDEIINEEEEADEAEVANLCLMADTDADRNQEKDEVDCESSDDEDELSVETIISDSMKLLKYYNVLQKSYKEVMKENKELKANLEEKPKEDTVPPKLIEENKSLLEKNKVLEKQNQVLKRDLENFVKGKENLDKMLGSQRGFYDKTGIGFEETVNSFPEKELKAKNEKAQFLTNKICYKCRRKGHLSNDCSKLSSVNYVRNPFVKMKQVWVPKGSLKGTSTNPDRTQGKLGT